MSDLLVFALLLLALLLGYLFGLYRAGKKSIPPLDGQSAPSHEVVLGLNYLINDQTDAAIEAFIQALQSNTESVEPSIALAKLYCRRGELDKAVLICQQQLARPSLAKDENAEVLQALGEAYLKAGWLDRAESLFYEVIKSDVVKADAARLQLLRIYEKEHAWQKAIETGRAFVRRQPNIGQRLAHYCLEIAEKYFELSEYRSAQSFLSKALKFDRASSRARILQIRMYAVARKKREILREADALLSSPEGGRLLIYFDSALRECFVSNEAYFSWLQDLFRRSPSAALLNSLLSKCIDGTAPEAADEWLVCCLDDPSFSKTITSPLLFALALLASRHCFNSVSSVKLDELFRELKEKNSTLTLCGNCGSQEYFFEWQCSHCGVWKN